MGLGHVHIDYTPYTVLVIGDVMVDIYIEAEEFADVDDSVEKWIYNPGERWSLGGAGNLVANFRALGAAVDFYTLAGEDDLSEWIYEECRDIGVDPYMSLGGMESRTNMRLRYIVDDKGIFGTAYDNKREPEDWELENLEDYIVDNKLDGIIFSDYNAGVCSQECIQRIMMLANEREIPVFVDPMYENFWEYKGATIFKPNWKEATTAMSGLGFETYEWWKAADTIRRNLACRYVVLTQGSSGLGVSKENFQIFPAHEVKVVDPCGAGDSTMAVLCMEYLRTGDIFKAAELANWAGACTVQKAGTGVITIAELESEIKP